MRRPIVQISILAFVAVLIFLIASMGGEQAGGTLPAFVNVDEAHQMYTEGTFVLDVRTPEEWNDYHAPDTTLIPLDELASRVNELPKDQPIVVICRSGNRSQTGRDILLQAGFNATSVNGGLNQWRDSGYPVVSGP
jgi:rhodanese-related sulfurtransferase